MSYNESEANHTVSTSNVFISNSWTKLVVTYSNASDKLTVYANETVSEPSNALLRDEYFPLQLMHLYTEKALVLEGIQICHCDANNFATLASILVWDSFNV